MSTWNIKLKERKVPLVIRKIIRRWEKHTNDFPAMEILDQNKRSHLISYLDLDSVCTREQWDQICEGTKITAILREQVRSFRISQVKPRIKKTEKGKIPQSPYYRWTCLICGNTGIISYEVEVREEPLRIGTCIIEAHGESSPKCKSESFRIIDHNGQDKTEEFMQIMGLKAKESGK